MGEVCIPPSQREIAHGDKNKFTQVLHSLRSGLRDAGVKVHQVFQFIHGVGRLRRTLTLAVRTETSKLCLHVLLHAKMAPVETRGLIADYRCFSCRLFPPSYDSWEMRLEAGGVEVSPD